MFQSARVKLTAWYLIIIMLISVLFSIIIYNVVNSELVRFDNQQRFRQAQLQQLYGNSPFAPAIPEYNAAIVNEARSRLILILTVINLGILAVAGGAGYFLAGRTLRPIKEMIDEQHRFITDASHELRTPLTALRSEIEVSLRDPQLSKDEAKQLLESNLEEVINLQVLSDNLLQLSQSSVHKHQLQPVAVTQVVEAAIKKTSPAAKKKHIVLEQHLEMGNMVGDEISLTQLCTILLDNAIKYSMKGTTVRILTKQTEHSVLIEIADQGMGIREEDLAHIFERFYRGDTARGKKVDGYGLGLSIAKKIITQHNGKITIKSLPNKGTTFTLLFPASKSIS